jgi:UDP-4-amino-4,6-dideoxy-N-acetyl-beta-L-altrosamine N-acetyltransferase
MYFEQYGIKLSRLQESDLELLRHWRNAPLIRETMEFRDFISPEMQIKWFNSINNIHNIYMLISYRDEKIGLINAKNINWEEKSFESGIFFWDTNYYNSFVPAIVSLLTTSFAFKILNYNILYAHVLKTNHHAIKYNLKLGYELCEGQEEKENQLYSLSLEKFNSVARKFKRVFEAFTEGSSEGKIMIEPHDHENELGDFVIAQLTGNGLSYHESENGKAFLLPPLF